MKKDGTIILHPKLGVNARVSFCPRCGQDNGELIFFGAKNSKVKCASCGCVNYGMTRSNPCARCGEPLLNGEVEELHDSERVPGSLCASCKEETERFNAIVQAGGVFFKCKGCGANGVVSNTNPICAQVRKQLGVEPPRPCGVEVEVCSSCPPEKIEAATRKQ